MTYPTPTITPNPSCSSPGSKSPSTKFVSSSTISTFLTADMSLIFMRLQWSASANLFHMTTVGRRARWWAHSTAGSKELASQIAWSLIFQKACLAKWLALSTIASISFSICMQANSAHIWLWRTASMWNTCYEPSQGRGVEPERRWIFKSTVNCNRRSMFNPSLNTCYLRWIRAIKKSHLIWTFSIKLLKSQTLLSKCRRNEKKNTPLSFRDPFEANHNLRLPPSSMRKWSSVYPFWRQKVNFIALLMARSS